MKLIDLARETELTREIRLEQARAAKLQREQSACHRIQEFLLDYDKNFAKLTDTHMFAVEAHRDYDNLSVKPEGSYTFYIRMSDEDQGEVHATFSLRDIGIGYLNSQSPFPASKVWSARNSHYSSGPIFDTWLEAAVALWKIIEENQASERINQESE